MLKQKPTGKSPLLNNGHPKLDEIKIKPIDDLLTQLATKLSEEPEEAKVCSYGCGCEPCISGQCSACLVDAQRRREEDRMMGYDSDPRERSSPYWNSPQSAMRPPRPYAQDGFMRRSAVLRTEELIDRNGHYNLPTWVIREWVETQQGIWLNAERRPLIRSWQDQDHWDNFLQMVLRKIEEEQFYREEWMERRRMEQAEMLMRMTYETPRFIVNPKVPMAIKIEDEWKKF